MLSTIPKLAFPRFPHWGSHKDNNGHQLSLQSSSLKTKTLPCLLPSTAALEWPKYEQCFGKHFLPLSLLPAMVLIYWPPTPHLFVSLLSKFLISSICFKIKKYLVGRQHKHCTSTDVFSVSLRKWPHADAVLVGSGSQLEQLTLFLCIYVTHTHYYWILFLSQKLFPLILH